MKAPYSNVLLQIKVDFSPFIGAGRKVECATNFLFSPAPFFVVVNQERNWLALLQVFSEPLLFLLSI
jgi:hypothetical protein